MPPVKTGGISFVFFCCQQPSVVLHFHQQATYLTEVAHHGLSPLSCLLFLWNFSSETINREGLLQGYKV